MDKHAAHERLIFESLKEKTDTGTLSFLVECMVTFDRQDKAAILENMDYFSACGVEIEDYYGLREQLLKYKPGDTVTLTVYRYAGISGSGESVELRVTLTAAE